jgi:hypothetical protein
LNCFRFQSSVLSDRRHHNIIFFKYECWNCNSFCLGKLQLFHCFSAHYVQNFRLRERGLGPLLGLRGSVAACSRIWGLLNY